LLTVFLALSSHPQSPAAEILYPKADSVNASDVAQKDSSTENEAIVTTLDISFLFEFILCRNTANNYKKIAIMGINEIWFPK
jgi:hypothetical protein